jgi:hypothetical protein
MSSTVVNVALRLGDTRLTQYRDSVIASGVALLLVYAVYYIIIYRSILSSKH